MVLQQKGYDCTVIPKIKNLDVHFLTFDVLNVPMELAAKGFQNS